MKIYLASSLSHECRPDMYRALKELRELGHDVYGPVEHTIKNAWDYSNQDWGRLVFEEDIRAINAADCIVAISYGRTKTTAGSSEMDAGPQSLMVSNGSHATVKGLEGLLDYDFASMPRLMTEAEQK